MIVRGGPPLRLSVNVETPNGNRYRWGNDTNRAQDITSALSFDTVMPGGFDMGSVTLGRNPRYAYADLTELSHVDIRGAGGEQAAEYRIEGSPAQTGDQMSIQAALTGYQAELDDDQTAIVIYVDQNQSAWTTMSTQRKLNLYAAGWLPQDSSQTPDQSSGEPSVLTSLTGPWAQKSASEAWYDGLGATIGTIFYSWKRDPTNVNNGDTSWSWGVGGCADDVGGAAYSTGPLLAAGPGSGLLTGLSGYFAFVQLTYDMATTGNDGISFDLYWIALAVYGNHGLPLQGSPVTNSQTGNKVGGYGLLSSDIEGHAISRWAPGIEFTTGLDGSIQPSSYPIPQAVFTSPGSAATIIKNVTSYELRDWAVWEDKTYYSNAYGARGRRWHARAREAKLQNAGPQISRLFNGVVISYSDVTGIQRTVGPPGTSTNVQSADLLDSDPTNPVNQAGLKRYGQLTMNVTSTPGVAAQVGRLFLQQQKLIDTAGSAALTGYVQDDSGVICPAWKVRAGDRIRFTDAADTSYRRIVSTSYDDSSKTNTVQLDQPPDSMSAILSRLQVSLAPIIGT